MVKKQDNHQSYKDRKVNIRDIRQTFLIICEGEKTEPNYFKSFRLSTLVIEVKGVGMNPTKVVESALDFRKEDDYDQVWCVFDRDSFNDFNSAIELARKEGMSVAYSNEAFELWYVLHFDFLNTGIPRSDYQKKLTGKLGHKYQKNSATSYDEIIELQPITIKNARRLLTKYNPINPQQDNPSTTVHLLVSELNKFIP